MRDAARAGQPAAAWPADGLEDVGACPLCGSRARRRLYADLSDEVFFSTSTRWQLHRCGGCGAAYLDPRPTPATLPLAYARYYTHSGGEGAPPARPSARRALRSRLVNGYTNWRFGTRQHPASSLGVLALGLAAGVRHELDASFRHLPKVASTRPVLLDVGCGNGDFLSQASACGWSVVGVDPDPAAVSEAARRGHDARVGGIELFERDEARFDVITMSHVIEHVYDPNALVRACWRVLRPHGQLWLETPNLDSLGHARFGRHWRGLEPPRHLVLFDRPSLLRTLHDAGFDSVREIVGTNPCKATFTMSQRMRDGFDAHAPRASSRRLRAEIAVAKVAGRLMRSRREYLTVVATRGEATGPARAGAGAR